MKPHSTPRLYLEGFANDSKLFVYDRKKLRSFPASTSNVGLEADLWSEKIEKRITEEIENPVTDAWRKLQHGGGVDLSMRSQLAKYIVFLYKRVTAARKRVIEMIPDVAESIGREITAEVEQGAIDFPETAHRLAGVKSTIEQTIRKISNEKNSRIWSESMFASENSAQVVDVMLGMRWLICRSPGDQVLTSDNPVYIHSGIGLSHVDSELTLPINASTYLWLTRLDYPDGATITVGRAAVREINRRVVSQSDRFVFAEREEPWMPRFINKTEHVLNRLR